ncbi:MAG: chorismate synthase [Clostridia bacterium]|nr:chorismate synthase [Clostridia bacterium]
MRASFGEQFKLTIFGESHGASIGMVVDGIPAGTPIDEAAIALDMARRAPGRDPTATARKEADRVRIVSGLFEGRATGAPLCGLIENTNTRSGDYAQLRERMRPGHADYAGRVKYGGFNDPRGGGHFSGRITAPLVFAGAIARQLLRARGIEIGAHIAAIGGVGDAAFDPIAVDERTLAALRATRFPLLDPAKETPMREAVERARLAGDSVGGVIECAAVGVPAGIGSPFFGSVESVTSALLFSVPAVKAVSFGDGMEIASLRGSEANDAMRMRDGRPACLTNHNGGVTGGITNGMPIVLRAAVKPTPSIAKEQLTVNPATGEDVTLCVTGRHDPCIVPRAVVVVESALALALCELVMDDAATRALKAPSGGL